MWQAKMYFSKHIMPAFSNKKKDLTSNHKIETWRGNLRVWESEDSHSDSCIDTKRSVVKLELSISCEVNDESIQS